MTSQALASLTATYTDSEGEESIEDDQPSPERDKEPPPLVEGGAGSAPSTGVSPKRRLVSYVDDTLVSDGSGSGSGEDEDEEEEDEEEDAAEGGDDMRRLSMDTDTDSVEDALPPEPTARCPKDLQDTIARFHQRMLSEGLDMNRLIQDKKNFRNPSIYEKLIQFCDINELDTNYPPEVYDPLRWGRESYYDELAKAQKAEMDRREKEKKDKLAKIEFITGNNSSTRRPDSDEEKKRKSKWDQAAPNVSQNAKPAVTQPGLLQQPLTASATGTKGTIISAFGSLPKKPKI